MDSDDIGTMESSPSLHNFGDIIKELLPSSLVENLTLCSDSSQFIYYGDRTNGSTKIDYVTEKDAADYLERTSLRFKKPCAFTRTAGENLGFLINERDYNMFLTDDTEKHQVSKTLGGLDHAGGTKLTRKEFQDYLLLPMESREASMAILNITFANTYLRYSFRSPTFLTKNDMTQSVKEQPDDFRDLSKTVSLIGKWTVSNFMCHGDGALVYLSPINGRMLLFLLLKPTREDYYLLDRVNTTGSFDFIPKQFSNPSGRVVCVLLEPGESIVFRDKHPHAFIACDDANVFGGRYIFPQTIPTMLKFDQSGWKRSTAYSPDHIKQICYQGAGRVVAWLFANVNDEDRSQLCQKIFSDFYNFLRIHGATLQISDETWNLLILFCGLVLLKTHPSLIRHSCGVLYKASSRNILEPVLKSMFTTHNYTLAPFNSIAGKYDRFVFPPKPSDPDYCPTEFIRRMYNDRACFHPLAIYHKQFGVSPGVYLDHRNGLLGMFAFTAIAQFSVITEYTGELMEESVACGFYKHENLPGKCYLFNHFYHKNRRPIRFILDANRHGSNSIFYRTSPKPNARIAPGCLGARMALLVVALTNIAEGEEVTVPPGINPDIPYPGDIDLHVLKICEAGNKSSTTTTEVAEKYSQPIRQSRPGQKYMTTFQEIDTNLMENDITNPRQTPPTNDEEIQNRSIGSPSPKYSPIGSPRKVIPIVVTPVKATIPHNIQPSPPQSSARGLRTDHNMAATEGKAVADDQIPGPSSAFHKVQGRSPTVFQELATGEDSFLTDNLPLSQPRKYANKKNSAKRRKELKKIENPQSENVYNLLDITEQSAVQAFKSKFRYSKFEDYDAKNKECLELYGKAGIARACALCAHYGKAIEKHDKPFHPLSNKRSYILHWKRIHKRKYKCTICNVKYDNKKAYKSHEREMKDNPKGAHIAENERLESIMRMENPEAGATEEELVPPREKKKRGRPKKASVHPTATGEKAESTQMENENLKKEKKRGRPKKSPLLSDSPEYEGNALAENMNLGSKKKSRPFVLSDSSEVDEIIHESDDNYHESDDNLKRRKKTRVLSDSSEGGD